MKPSPGLWGSKLIFCLWISQVHTSEGGVGGVLSAGNLHEEKIKQVPSMSYSQGLRCGNGTGLDPVCAQTWGPCGVTEGKTLSLRVTSPGGSEGSPRLL